MNQYQERYYATNRDTIIADNIKRSRAIKLEVLTHYSKNGVCACVNCGFDNLKALSIDHINGNGAEHRRETHKSGAIFYVYLKKNNYPEGYQTLCMNCQWIKKQDNGEFRHRVTHLDNLLPTHIKDISKPKTVKPKVNMSAENWLSTVNRYTAAKETGLDISHISRVLSGKCVPSMKALQKIADYLSMPSQDLASQLKLKMVTAKEIVSINT